MDRTASKDAALSFGGMMIEVTPYMAVDTETTGLNTEEDYPFFISICNTKGETLAVDTTPKNLQMIFAKPFIPIFHNAKFDIKMLENLKQPQPEQFEDTMLMAHLTNEYHQSVSLAHLSKKYLSADKIQDEDFRQWLRDNKQNIKRNGYLHAPRELLEKYARNDVLLTMKLFYLFRGALEKKNLLDQYAFEKRVLLFLIRLERTGIGVDVKYALEQLQTLVNEEHRCEEKFQNINLRSPLQVKAAFAKIGVVLHSTAKDVLISLSKKSSPAGQLAKDILKYRTLNQLTGHFLIPILNETSKSTKRLHTCFNQHITKTGRLSSSSPNLQNIPRVEEDRAHSDIGRRLFIPKEEYLFIGADYNQMEMRIIAHVSKDPTLIDLFNKGTQDIYTDIAKLIWPTQKITKYKRWSAKQTVLGMSFGMGTARFIKQAKGHGFDVPYQEAEDTRNIFHERFPLIRERIQALSWQIRNVGYVEDIFHRKYHVPKDFAYKAFNAVVQGTAAGVMKRALLNLQATIDYQQMPLQIVNVIHDEVLCEVHVTYDRYKAMKTIINNMTMFYGLFSVPITADPKYYSYSWAENVQASTVV